MSPAVRRLLPLLLFCLAAPLACADAVVLRFSLAEARDTPNGRAAERFRQLAARYTQGKVEVRIFPSGELYKDREDLGALQVNAVQMLAPAMGKLARLGLRRFELFDLPYLFPDDQAVHRVLDGPSGRALFEDLDDYGLVGLTYWDEGFLHFSANRSLKRAEDFRGLKLRVAPAPLLEARLRALGAQPRPMAADEAFGALEQGLLDGAEFTLPDFDALRMQSAQRHLALSWHGWQGSAVVVNKRFWDDLPNDLRGGLIEALRQATVYQRKLAAEDNRRALAAITATGVTEVQPIPLAERERMRQLMRPVLERYAEGVDRALLERVQKVIGTSRR